MPVGARLEHALISARQQLSRRRIPKQLKTPAAQREVVLAPALVKVLRTQFRTWRRPCGGPSRACPPASACRHGTACRRVRTDRRSAGAPVRQLLDTLMGEPEQFTGVADAQAELPGQEAHGLLCGALRRETLPGSALSSRAQADEGLACCGDELHLLREASASRIVNEQGESLSNAAPRLSQRPPLRVATTNLPDRRDPPTLLVPLVGHRVGLHRGRNHPEPRQGSRSRSMARSNPGPMSSPAWTGTVVTHFPQRTRTCDPRWRSSAHPSRRSRRSSSFAGTEAIERRSE